MFISFVCEFFVKPNLAHYFGNIQAGRSADPQLSISDLIQAINQLEKKKKATKEKKTEKNPLKKIPYRVPQDVSSPGNSGANWLNPKKAVPGKLTTPTVAIKIQKIRLSWRCLCF